MYNLAIRTLVIRELYVDHGVKFENVLHEKTYNREKNTSKKICTYEQTREFGVIVPGKSYKSTVSVFVLLEI